MLGNLKSFNTWIKF